jgi:glycosyltransferase involved in cell wall biosynthesis
MDKTNKAPLFSIIIPTFNSGRTLSACLDSIFCQTFTDYEVWIIDGVSADDTLQITKRYSGEYPGLHIASGPDQGIYDAMNKGVISSKGDWLYFLGSDDTLYNEHVLQAVSDTISTSGAEVVYGNVMMRGENQWNLNNKVFNGEYDLPKLIIDNICHQAIFYNRSVFQKHGCYDLKYITSADYDFNIRAYAYASFQYIDLIIANFFVGGHSTHVPDTAIVNDRGALLLKYYGKRIFSRSFIPTRLYIQRAAFSKKSPLPVQKRFYCMLAYLKLKAHAMWLKEP